MDKIKRMTITKPWYLCPVVAKNGVKPDKIEHRYLFNDGMGLYYDVSLIVENENFIIVRVYSDDGSTTDLEVSTDLVRFYQDGEPYPKDSIF